MISLLSACDVRRLVAMTAVSCSLAVFAAEKLPTGYGNPANDIASGSVAGLTWQGAARAYKIGGEVVLVFTNTAAGSCSFEIASKLVADVRYLLVGGGGPGGFSNTAGNVPGGGGAGGMITGEVSVAEGAYSVTVGAGGLPVETLAAINNKGGDSVITDQTAHLALRAYGGGGGGMTHGANETDQYSIGVSGGSGGGAAVATYGGRSFAGRVGGAGVTGQGNKGGDSHDDEWAYRNGGGGGGAGAPGQDSPSNATSGKGGDGLPCDITGEEVWYAGGGAGGAYYGGGNPVHYLGGAGGGGESYGQWHEGCDEPLYSRAGVDALGGGGAGASGHGWVGVCAAGRGGNGVVIVRFTRILKQEDPLPDVSFTGEAEWYNIGRGKTRETVVIYTNVNEVGTLTLGRRATARVLLVGGGGPGGYASAYNMMGGGGGAGGVVSNECAELKRGVYEIVVGKGGLPSNDRFVRAGNGGDSIVTFQGAELYRAFGGGAGGNANGDNLGNEYSNPAWGANGGCGGGGATYYSWWNQPGAGGTGSQGFNGGNAKNNGNDDNGYYRSPGGGGGAGAAGGSPSDLDKAGAGGNGIVSRITGEEVWYAGGGAGGTWGSWGKVETAGGNGGGGATWVDAYITPNSGKVEDGEDGLGGGGGGSSGGTGSSGNLLFGPGRGGNGVVIVRITSVAPDGMAVFVK